jgi:hypothetical protein
MTLCVQYMYMWICMGVYLFDVYSLGYNKKAGLLLFNLFLPLLYNRYSSLCYLQFSRHYQKKNVVGLERSPLSLVSTTEELLDRKVSGSCLENREYGRRDPSRWPRDTLYPQKLAITSPTSGGRSVGIVRSRTQTMEFSYLHLYPYVTCVFLYKLVSYLNRLLERRCLEQLKWMSDVAEYWLGVRDGWGSYYWFLLLQQYFIGIWRAVFCGILCRVVGWST